MNTIFEKLKDENEGRDFSKIEKIYDDIMRVCEENKNVKDIIIISEKIKELKKYKTFNKEFYIKFISILI